jgi:type I restriction-modification system DNA methylase subunit
MDMTRSFNDRNRPPPDHQKQIVRLIEGLAYRHDKWQIFSDFAEAAAISVSNAVDLQSRDTREARYTELIKRYRPDELAKFPQMLGELTLALEEGFTDVLGQVFHDLELHNKYSGQYFTPYTVCRMMAQMTLGSKEAIAARIAERGFITACEPAAGSGAMVIALAEAMCDEGINYQQHLHVTAVDVDPKCVHMAYLQFSLLHIPAVIVHGNSLTLEEWGHWHTPAHIMGGWNWKLRRQADPEETHELHAAPEPILPSLPLKRPDDDDEPGPAQLTLF